MPSIKDFESKSAAAADSEETPKASKRARRRPGRESAEAVESAEASASPEAKPSEEAVEESMAKGSVAEDAHVDPEDEGRRHVHIDFYGSDLLRARAPKAFELAETVAEEWVNDGRFEGLPVGHPLAQAVAQIGLRKAKDLEKKLEEKGVFMLARVGVEFAKSKLGRR